MFLGVKWIWHRRTCFRVTGSHILSFLQPLSHLYPQISTWTNQYQAAAHQDIPAMDQLSKWLMNNLPDGDNEESLIHGDFKLDNIVFHPKEVVSCVCDVLLRSDLSLQKENVPHPPHRVLKELRSVCSSPQHRLPPT